MYNKLKEKWAPCRGYEGLYEISNKGKIRSLLKGTRIIDDKTGIMKQKIDTHGYYRINLHKNKTMKSELISRLVAMAFIPNPNNFLIVGHKDDNKKNNTIKNLYWTTIKENNHHNGKYEKLLIAHNEKIKMISKKLSKPIIAINNKTGEQINFCSIQECSRVLGLNSGKISLCCNGKRHKAGGYEFKWAK